MAIDLLPMPAGPACNANLRLRRHGTHREIFASLVMTELKMLDAGFVFWEILPRYDKSLPELQYRIGNKNLDADKAEKYL